MRDKVYMVLAFIGFVIIAVVVVINRGAAGNTYYEIGSSYVPAQRTDLMSSKELYNQLTGLRALTCPAITRESTKNGRVVLTSIWGSYYDHPYDLSCLFLSNNALSSGSTINPSLSSFESDLMLSAEDKTADSVLIKDLFTVDVFGTTGCTEIIAPFTFMYSNMNTSVKIDDSTKAIVQDIVITNLKGNCRITFSNVANWFCAGPIGTESLKSNTSDGIVAWENHATAHHSIIGDSPNAIVRGGVSGDVIGYANSNTSITIEVFENGSFKKVSVYKFILPTS